MGVDVFQVGKIHVNVIFKPCNVFNRFVTVCVIYYWYGRSINFERFDDLCRKLRRAYEIDIMRAFVREFTHYIGKSSNGNILAVTLRAYLLILTEHATHITAAEKYCAAPLRAAYYRYFIEKQIGKSDFNFVAHFTKTDVFFSIDIAVSRTNRTVHMSMLAYRNNKAQHYCKNI